MNKNAILYATYDMDGSIDYVEIYTQRSAEEGYIETADGEVDILCFDNVKEALRYFLSTYDLEYIRVDNIAFERDEVEAMAA